MKEYHKIQTVYLRNHEDNYKTLIEGAWSKPEFKVLKDINWICTEKIDGTNIRIMWDGIQVRFGGKTDKATLPGFLIKELQNIFTNEIMAKCFPDSDNVCLYGEGYGKKIQKGHNYIPDKASFILFDIKIGDWWLSYSDIADISRKFNIEIVPIIGIFKLKQAIKYVENGFKSMIAHNKDYIAEGLIMKPEIELFNRAGERIITKIKYKDFVRAN